MSRPLRFPDQISTRQAGKKVSDFLLSAEHNINPRPRTPVEAQQFVDHVASTTGVLLVQKARHYREPLPYIENMAAGSTWQLSSGVSITDRRTGAVIATGPGEASTCTYQTLFEKAFQARERAVDQASYIELGNAITLGLSSIDGFLNFLAQCWQVSALTT